MEAETYHVCSANYEIDKFSTLAEANTFYKKCIGSACLATKLDVLESKPEDKNDEGRLMKIGFLVHNKLLMPKTRSMAYGVLWHDEGGQQMKEFSDYEIAMKYYKKISSSYAKAFFNCGNLEMSYGYDHKYHCMGFYAELQCDRED